MTAHFVIDTAHGEIYYSATYLAAVLLTAAMALHAGFTKGYPGVPWLMLIVTGGLFFMIGEKIASYSPGQWAQVFMHFQFPPTQKKTILGGIAGLFAGLLLAKTWLRFYKPVPDTFALAMPLAMAISRIGCLMAGCCFGTTTGLPWGIRYGSSSGVFQTHYFHGLVQIHDKASAAIHPIQVYELLGCLLIASIVWLTRKLWKANGNLFLFAVVCYALLRFLIEFVRDPGSSFVLSRIFLGLKEIQWVLATFVISGFLILIIRERGYSNSFKVPGQIRISTARRISLLILLGCITITGRNWFTALELAAILIFMIPLVIISVVELYQNQSEAVFRRIAPFFKKSDS